MSREKKVIKIVSESIGQVFAEMLEHKNPKTADIIWRSLPLEGVAERWGDEVYFEVLIDIEEENSQEVVEKGDVAYWPPGRAICIFFGPTSASRGDEIRLTAPSTSLLE